MSRVKIEDLTIHRTLENEQSEHIIGAGAQFVITGRSGPWGSQYQHDHQHYGNSWDSWSSSGTWHDTSHFDYTPGYYWQHGDHVHYEPGYWNYHQTGHWHP